MGIFQYGVSGVDLFFVISGIVISAVTVGKFHDVRRAMTFLYHRLARVYPILWVYSLLVLAVYLVHPEWINGGSGHHLNLIGSFLLIPGRYTMLIMQGWTLSFEIYFYIAFFLLLFGSEKAAPWLLALWGAAIVLFNVFHPVPQSPLLGTLTSPFILEFLGGCLLFHLYRRFPLHPAVGVALVAASFLWLGAVMLTTHYSHGSGAYWIMVSPFRCVLYGGFAFLLLAGAMELERTGLIRFARPLVAIGDWSYSIYLSHIIVIEIFARALVHFIPHLPYAILVVDVLAMAAVITVGYLSYTLLEVPLLNLFYKRSATT